MNREGKGSKLAFIVALAAAVAAITTAVIFFMRAQAKKKALHAYDDIIDYDFDDDCEDCCGCGCEPDEADESAQDPEEE